MASVGKPIMAGSCPAGPLTDPALKEAYKGCSVYSYYDQSKRRQLVMFDKNTRVRHGTKEAHAARNKTNMELRYTLQLVNTVDD